ncbi:GNAT family N-acetyltransferase [Roseomonas stagni]|uniref:GNAT family N-acetyltransferase n=1 Tax=Falsiroseomonas algicola TaxID=2716930 RepID=A0A6M1LFZ2_9PROT|nr:GNAT family N-acetyltransferase [Falsiroseomonas algicola]NGM18959.1 GNAT family N-acetyltransferase [Falsiroseomonas algicola]
MTTVRTLTPEEAVTAVEWAAVEGWNPGLSDLGCFLVQDPGLFLAVEEGGRLASVISATRYGTEFGFIGFYIARPEVRGQGLGMRVWQAAMARLAGRLIGLDGVVAQQANYRKSGFSLAWNNIRFGGVPAGAAAASADVVEASGVPFSALAALDRSVFPAAREAFLRAWLSAPGHVALAVVRDGEVAGFGVIRPAREGHKIGPLVAQDRGVAERLLVALIARIPAGGPVFLDVAEPRREAVALAEGLGLKPVFETARMYTGPAPAIRLERLFGVTTFELG